MARMTSKRTITRRVLIPLAAAGLASVGLAAASPAAADHIEVHFDYDVPAAGAPGNPMLHQNAKCPGTNPYLVNQLYAGPILPKGVAVWEHDNYAVVVKGKVYTGADHYAIGVLDMSLTNGNLDNSKVTVVLHCTSDKSEGYQQP